jgi:hypothetical protein
MEIGLLNGRQSQIAIRTLVQVGYRRRDLLAKGRPPLFRRNIARLCFGEISPTFGKTSSTFHYKMSDLSPMDFHPWLHYR